jgi:hypothetical protein
MAHDYYSILGLSPGRYDAAEITRHFQARRAELLAQLGDAARYDQTRRDLDQLHLAYAALRDPGRQDDCLRLEPTNGDALKQLRGVIAASLEDGLLRYSRRQDILARGRELGLGDFQTQLLIAQVQFGTQEAPLVHAAPPARRSADSRTWARWTGVGVLALTIFLFLVRWVNG